MNKYFKDTRYYLKRAVQTAKRGVKEELEPIETRFREMTGNETDPEPSRIDQLRDELKALEARAEGEARDAIANARSQLHNYRNRSE